MGMLFGKPDIDSSQPRCSQLCNMRSRLSALSSGCRRCLRLRARDSWVDVSRPLACFLACFSGFFKLYILAIGCPLQAADGANDRRSVLLPASSPQEHILLQCQDHLYNSSVRETILLKVNDLLRLLRSIRLVIHFGRDRCSGSDKALFRFLVFVLSIIVTVVINHRLGIPVGGEQYSGSRGKNCSVFSTFTIGTTSRCDNFRLRFLRNTETIAN